MKFLGINTYSKDLLEFGACQGWDSTPYGGNDWVYYNNDIKHWWAEIVALMGTYGFDVLPYYEYSGSKGKNGIGHQRRCKPLGRDDAYTHVKWIESANADITDPEVIADFRKMLDLTVIRLQDKADFAGAWLRPRSQLPVSFATDTLKRFSDEANGGQPVNRDLLKKDRGLYDRYVTWWQVKRRDFLVAMRDHLRKHGVNEAVMLFTGAPGEPGVGFGDFEPRMITDKPEAWRPVLKQEAHKPDNDRKWQVLTPSEVARTDAYLKGLLLPGLTWGSWEVHHARPADDPATYRSVEGIMLTHAFNRLYTVASPKSLEMFRSPSGLAIMRHYALNENMMFDRNDQPRLGYFVADIERAGPYCMQAEAVAMANGDPTMIGYLSGGNFGRGFSQYVRDFNANFLALPALPSRRVDGAASVRDVVVRVIPTERYGTYYAVVNAGVGVQERVRIRLPGAKGGVRFAVSGDELQAVDGAVTLDLRPCQLVALRVAK